jgi:hypothetical protein
MKFEVVENDEEWIVRRDGVDVARFRDQDQALSDIAQRLRDGGDGELSYSLGVRYQFRT